MLSLLVTRTGCLPSVVSLVRASTRRSLHRRGYEQRWCPWESQRSRCGKPLSRFETEVPAYSADRGGQVNTRCLSRILRAASQNVFL
ncbi:hypothetical protein F4778DRAFT_154392 [Xylariomycetidae sp. FL2044]|nr:hypothetical protein F4778DRAFT_154392 [Xylariomycetidae sp. FL2044]